MEPTLVRLMDTVSMSMSKTIYVYEEIKNSCWGVNPLRCHLNGAFDILTEITMVVLQVKVSRTVPQAFCMVKEHLSSQLRTRKTSN